MPTLHVRNVPGDVYNGLRSRAERNGRSMNAEAVALLAEVLERDARAASVTEELRRLAREIKLPPDAPKPEEIIREERERRARRF